MASALRKMTGVGADVRQIAALLQAKAPKGHMLAYITPQEAALLKAEGGSGKPHADTGVPSFENEDAGNEFYSVGDMPQDSYAGPSSEAETVGLPPQVSETISAAPPPEISTFPTGSQFETPTAPVAPGLAGATPADIQQYMDIGAGRATALPDQAPAQDVGLMDKAAKATGLSKDTLARLGITGVQALLGGKQATQAREAGQAGKQEIQAVAAPYQAKGQELQAAAQRGELTPTGQQAIAAARAQAAQGAERRGGVGAQQMEAQVQALRNQLLQQQYDYGLKLSGIGDQMALGAIRTGMQADQYANQLTSSYFNNIARIAAGTPTATRPEVA
ncbi:hypothetical protein UFOVP1562_17 [uncultured Caudovirales phage]|uniref:Uncharacterized protein n=1 Tax=uncultured Caudovirales phage TaxID=2100421 RepID=A0A6J7XFW4_9CAUD|nr:hypothetical protein UFOVP1562_17 [uncultured Caudovirales phage]